MNYAPVSGAVKHAANSRGNIFRRALRAIGLDPAAGQLQLLRGNLLLISSSSTIRGPRLGAAWWPELLASLLSFAGLILAILPGFHPGTWQGTASDLKTLYAAADCFPHNVDPYRFANIAAVFDAGHVVQPMSWYAHAPVYPPFTLAIIAPLTAIPMVPAMFFWLVLSCVILALAAFVLSRAAAEIFLLSRPWRLALIGLFAALPLLSFGVEMCNVSVVVGALSIIPVALPQHRPLDRWISVGALVMGLLLKPHSAMWVVVALVVSRSGADRRIGLRSIAVSAAFVLALAAWMAVHHQLIPQLTSYRDMVHAELSTGSMSPTNRELSAIGGEITSLASLLGYGLSGLPLSIFTGAGLLSGFGMLVYLSLRRRSSRRELTRFTRIAAWSTFGLMATYHRAHDAVFLVLVLPYLLARLRMHWRDPFPWTIAVLATIMGAGPSWDAYQWLATKPGLWHISNFFLYRQAPLAAALLLALLTADIARFPMSSMVVLPDMQVEQDDLAEAA